MAANPYFTLGQVRTNSFKITKRPEKCYEQYDAIIPPGRDAPDPKPDHQKNRRIMHHLQVIALPERFHPRLVYDGTAIAYAPLGLNIPPSGERFHVTLYSDKPVEQGTPGAYTVVIARAALQSSVNPQHVDDLVMKKTYTPRATVAINLMQLIVRQGPDMSRASNARAFYFDNATEGRRGAIGFGLEVWHGVVQSVRPALNDLILTIDTTAAAVYKPGPLIDVLMNLEMKGETRRQTTGNIRDICYREGDPRLKQAERFLKRVLVNYCVGTRASTKKIVGLVTQGGRYRFEKAGIEMTVQDYLRQTYNITLRYPDLPGAVFHGRENIRLVIPIELCNVEPGQLYKRKLDPGAVSAMLSATTVRPNERLARIQRAADCFQQSMYVHEAKMDIETTPMIIPAKILKPVAVAVANDRQQVVTGGVWKMDQQASCAGVLKYWGILNLCPGRLPQQQIQEIVLNIKMGCTGLGMGTADPMLLMDSNPSRLEMTLGSLAKDIMRQAKSRIPGLDLDQNANLRLEFQQTFILFVILPVGGSHLRTSIKHWGDCNMGMKTQCMREEKCIPGPKSRPYFSNLALKINARLGGINFHSIKTDPLLGQEFRNTVSMVIGADVSHPSPGMARPSVASLVYSYDPEFARYDALTGIQQARTEVIAELAKFVYTAITRFGDRNHRMPDKIFFFRDGVSEGEFSTVKEKELAAIKYGAAKVIEDRKLTHVKPPTITFIVVGKRHNALFFPANQANSPRSGNVEAGVVIDSSITHPTETNFYLQSHAAIQGTSRSGHYTVLEDENYPGQIDKLERLAYLLCHSYAKCTRSVSIPAPVYYADLVCGRGAHHFSPDEGINVEDDSASVSSSGSPRLDIDQYKKLFKPTHPFMKGNMYFL